MIRIVRCLVPVVLALSAYLTIATPGFGHAADPGTGVSAHWSCRASGGYVKLVGNGQSGHIEPFAANGDSTNGADRDACASDAGGFSQTLPPGGSASGQATIDGASVETRINADFTYKQTATANANVQHVKVAGPPGFVEADVVTAAATGSCVNGAPVLTTTSHVATLNVNGNQVGDEGEAATFGGGTHVIVKTNYDTPTTDFGGAQKIRRALHIRLAQDGTNYIEAVVGEVRVGYHGSATELCKVPAERCPEGSSFDATRGVCIIATTTTAACPQGSTRDASGACIIVVGAPSAQPGVGGNVVPLSDVRGYRGPCKNKRFGRQVAIIGTNRGDRITGSNKSDRIFVFGGNDKVSGGRGNECIEGGAGSDQLDGSTGSDWLLGGAGNDQTSGGPGNDYQYGGSGNDKLIGGTGNDHLYGGKGRNKLDGGKGNDVVVGGPSRDYIVGGNGRDRIRSGKGNDDINVATAGARAKVDCGAGVDTVRINNNEIRSVKHCERILVTTRLDRLRSYDRAYDRNK